MSTTESHKVALAGHKIKRPREEWRQPERTYRCMVYLMPEPDGGYSAVAADLPGVASQGDTEAEALANIVEAFQGVIAVYQERGEPIPWSSNSCKPEPGAQARWIIVHA